MTETAERDNGVEKLKARCHVYELERQALLNIINDMCGLLYDKYREEDEAAAINKAELLADSPLR